MLGHYADLPCSLPPALLFQGPSSEAETSKHRHRFWLKPREEGFHPSEKRKERRKNTFDSNYLTSQFN
jgi:hypothetical protein